MRIFLYEHLTAGGMSEGSDAAPDSLLTEGLAMARALAADLTQIPKLELRTLVSSASLGEQFGAAAVVVTNRREREAAFAAAVRWAEGVILLAPESGDVLYELARDAASLGGRLLSPSAAFVQIAGDKQRTAELLAAEGVPVPIGQLWRTGESLPLELPAVIKPIDGCGSQDVRLITSTNELPTQRGAWRLERFHAGQAASVLVLCGPRGKQVSLPACTQRLSGGATFAYQGGETPLPPALNERAQHHAERAVTALAQLAEPLGFVGVDLVLGPAEDGGDDIVIEVNPRLTTSYIGLRAASKGNLAEAMLRIALGGAHAVEFKSERIEFDPSGQVRQ